MTSIKQLLWFCIFLSLNLFIYRNGLADSKTSPLQTSNYSFYAIFNRLADTKSQDLWIENSAMSDDGSKLIFSATNKVTDELLLYLVNADGSNLTQISLPQEITEIRQVVITKDGSQAFFHQSRLIYKVEEGTASKIFSADENPDISGFNRIAITAGGEYIYIDPAASYRAGSIWRMTGSGGGVEKIMEYLDVQRDLGTGAGLSDFVISDDASTIAFILTGYIDNQNSFHYKSEVFTMKGHTFQQLTNDTTNLVKDYLTISGDGQTIVYNNGGEMKWYAIQSDGSGKTPLVDGAFNVAGPDLCYDGSMLFYSDGSANGGRLVKTDGSWIYDLFPDMGYESLYTYRILDISDDGQRTGFIHRDDNYNNALYVGFLNQPNAVNDAPVIESINFEPASMPTGDPDAKIILTSDISDPQGLADIEWVSVTEILDGTRSVFSYVPVFFQEWPHDDGELPDQIAGDGIFTSEGEPGGKIDEVDHMTVRLGVMDYSKTVVMADTILYTTTTDIDDQCKVCTPATRFILHSNFPNPFNPSTTIEFSLPTTTNVILKIFNTLGEEVVTLVSGRLSTGHYSFEWSPPVETASGVYLYRLEAEDPSQGTRKSFVETRKMILMR